MKKINSGLPAIEGGKPVRKKVFPNVGISQGRSLGKEEMILASHVIESGNLFRLGGLRMVEQFEKDYAKLYRVPFAHAVTSGTASLHTAVAALDLEPGDEIITSPITDMGTAIAILTQQCIPVFADVDPKTCNITAKNIEKQITKKTRAIIVVHLFGSPADMDPILKLARRHNLRVIEDAAQAHLAKYKGRLVGTMGDIGCFSLQQSKQITTGDGGILITSNKDLYARAVLFSDKAWPRTQMGQTRGHLFLGVNYRMNEITGAVALAQARKLKGIVRKRRKVAHFLSRKLQNVDGIILTKILPDCRSSWWMFSFYPDKKKIRISPAEFAKALAAEGIPAGCGYIPMPLFEYPVIRDRKTFGSSHLPWSLPAARKNIVYDRNHYPGTMKALTELIVFSWCEGVSEKDALDVYNAIKKLVQYYSR
ncbi:DegT/DnrJ/EryC1/StrS family aminotransferase [Candidatus Sumerlaeota bacterium]|nr:DegT/DnrJ/EryC1/StrS family aminotransferase [Candidatus Sumerlaeota bacterium]